MLCQICKNREATIILYETKNGKKMEMHICEECASLFTNKLSVFALPQFNLDDFLLGLLNAIEHYGKDEEIYISKELKCPECNLTYEEFKKSGKFGCDKCYIYFRKKITPLLLKLHGKERHSGKVPQKSKKKLYHIRKIEELKNELNESVLKEEYEKAAKIRDQIIKHEEAAKKDG